MKDKNIYLCGGMTGLTVTEYDGWREDLRDKFADIAPHLHLCNPANHFSLDKLKLGLCEDEEAMRYDLWKVRRSDLIVVNFNAPNSIGSCAEMAIAYDRDIPIVGVNEKGYELHPWLKMFCMKICSSMDELVAYIVDHFIYED